MVGQSAPRVVLYVREPRRLAPPPGRPPPDPPDGAYSQCPAPGPQLHNTIMPPMQSVAIRHPTDNFSEGTGDSEVVKSYVNYQFLEQSVNILNAGACEESRGAQLVRTAEGVLLAVLPELRAITVPLGWKRVLNGNTVLYFSPSGTPLSSLSQLKDYLQTEGTCKCGLSCPLRPEIAFSFDPKVSSKPYVAASGAELTKLCNHKRKLLATLQARAQDANAPALLADHNKVSEVGVLKKKMKKRAGFPAMSPQLVVQRDRPLTDIKLQESGLKRTLPPGASYSNQCMPTFAPGPLVTNPLQDEIKHENHVHKSSHYLTVSSGWITQNENPDHKPSHPNTPVFDNNGQIIGVNTGYKQPKNSTLYANNIIEQETKEQKVTVQNPPVKKEEESQIFCGLNQPLTPEVMQKINEQQQIFIQQNQNKIEMAMKGFRTQMAENANQNKPSFLPQGQLVIQNGAVVKANTAKTPPWQVKRHDSSSSMTSQSPKPQKMDSFEFDDSTNMSEDSSSSYGSFISNDLMNQSMCSRVPPLPQQYNLMAQQWPAVDANKKKPRANKGRKKVSPDNKIMSFGNNGIRNVEPKNQGDNIPSFMDDPSGFLAQQTVLLNNTISTFDGNQFESNKSLDKSKTLSKPCEVPSMYRHNMLSNSSPSPNNTPDSSVISDKHIENPAQCCKGCNVMKGSQEFLENQMRLQYMKPNVYKLELHGSCPRHFEDNPVTSSTFERSPMHDGCGPIQAGQVSTSNVSPPETLLPEPSPTLSNSSRNTDTPHSGGSNSSYSSQYPMPSPAYSNNSCKEFSSNPSTPGNQIFPYSSPGPNNVTGTQMMHFISNHNVNKNLMEVDNISMAVKPVANTQEVYRAERKRDNTMPGYCPPPHLGGGPAHSLMQACYVQTFVTTMASGFSVTRDTVTSVLAGKANTATTSINSSQANYVRLPPPPSVNMATSYAIPNNQPDPFINSVNIPTSYPLHIAGTTAQNMITRSPLEMVQNVINNVPLKTETSQSQRMVNLSGRRSASTTPGQILISSTGQIMVSNNQMPPPPPKTPNTSAMQSNASTSVPSGVQSMIPSTVVVNNLPAPFVIQPPMMSVDGQIQQNQVMSQIMSVPSQSPSASPRSEGKLIQGLNMLSPESKKRGKKKKVQANITNVLQISAPQHSNNVMVQHSPQHSTSPQFSPRGFQLSPNNNISPPGMLQALTIVPGKSGTPAHIVMNGQGGNNFSSQQIINTSPSQQINLLQPVNLINNGSGVVPNFPAFQQFIVPNIGGMMMTADGTIIQDNSNGMPVQLQLQTVNGQNVLTPVQNTGVFNNNSGVVIRQNQQGKIIQSQHSPGAQFLSPNSQVVVNSPNFSGQLSPLLANLSPTSVTFNANSQQVRSNNMQTQEFIQTNQMGQLMVPISPKQALPSSRNNSTFVQNTTIVQQQTTLVTNTHTPSTITNQTNRLSIDPNILLKPQRRYLELESQEKEDNSKPFSDNDVDNAVKFMNEYGLGVRSSVSTATQTLVNQRGGKSPGVSGCSPPDTTTHSPLGPLEPSSPRVGGARCLSTQANYADTTTKSPERDDSSQAMVQCVSSSEQDPSESEVWPQDYPAETLHNMGPKVMIPLQPNRNQNLGEPDYSQNMASTMASQHIPPPSNYYDRTLAYKRKNEFTTYRPDKMMRTNMSHNIKEAEYDPMGLRHQNYPSGPSSDMQKVFDRHLGPSDDATAESSNKKECLKTLSKETNPSESPKSTPEKHTKPDEKTSQKYETDESNMQRKPDEKMTHKSEVSESNMPEKSIKIDEKQSRKVAVGESNIQGKLVEKVFKKFEVGESNTPRKLDEKLRKAEVGDSHRKLEEKTRKLEVGESHRKEERTRKFEVGDLVWGPVKGYASWPGKLERLEDGGKWRVRWFGGDKAPGTVDDGRLQTLSEGLEAHHAARTKHRKSRKLNTLLENAIQEAMSDLDKKTDSPTHADTAASVSESAITDTPKRKKDKVKKDKKTFKICEKLRSSR